jgi:dipeptidyl aminopeptidase/acylaminoacyl peptidase
MAARPPLSVKHAAVAWLAIAPSHLVAQQRDTARFHLDIPSIMRGTETAGRTPTDVRWTSDSKWVYFQWDPPGTDWRAPLEPYRVRAEPGAAPEKLTRAQLDSAAPALATGPTTNDGKWRALSLHGDLWLVDVASGSERRLTQTAQMEQALGWSADQRRLFYRVGDAVFAMRVADGFVEQLADIRTVESATPDTAAGRGRGRAARGRGAQGSSADSAQHAELAHEQQELFQVLRDAKLSDSLSGGGGDRGGRSGPGDSSLSGVRPLTLAPGEQLRGVWVSPTGGQVLLTVRRSAAPAPTEVPTWITTTGYVGDITGRSKVGDAQGFQRIGLLDVATSKVTWMGPLAGDSSGHYARLTSWGWNDAGTSALVVAEAGNFKTRVIARVDAESGKVTPLATLHDSAWIGGPCDGCGGWLPGERGLWFASEADGYAHIYTMHTDGTDRRNLTPGPWEVRSADLNAARSAFEFHSSEVSPYEQQFYTMDLDGSHRTRMTPRVGGHDVTVSPDGVMYADVYSYSNEPPELYLQPAQAMAAATRVTTSPTAAWRAFKWLAPDIIDIPASDGAKVPARIYRPEQMGAKSNGAAVLFVHGAGYLQNVTRTWSADYFREYQFNQLLASKGYLVLDLDYRGSAGYGRDWRTAIYRHMGGRDLDDYVDASKWVTAKYGIAPAHIGIYGGSYGGFMTLMALFTKPGYFGAGAALRPVSNWANYNHGYTAEILNQPQDDTVAYHQSSPIFYADGLRAPLLIAHGMVDTNVEFEDTVHLIQRLIELGKTNWWIAPYPVENHGFVRPDSWTDEYRRILDLFDGYLPRGAPHVGHH